MRNNGQLTGKEVPVAADGEIVSSTDTRGNIQFCNDYFCKIAGYERSELLYQPHNILRHPDMPAKTFEMLWTSLKAGTPWMGIIKNRCKNGDHYWVDAYVTPLRDRGQVYGYESVRVRADAAVIKRAEKVYARLQANKPVCPLPEKLVHSWGATALTALLSFSVLLAVCFTSGKLTAGWIFGIF